MNPFQNPLRFAGLAACLLVCAAPLRAHSPLSPDALSARLDAVIAGAPGLKNALVGVLIQTPDGQTVYEMHPDFTLMPASNEKLLTSSAALAELGADFRYTTTLFRTGTIDKNGVLRGDLYLKGSGDPSFTSARLKSLADALVKSGIKRVEGRIIADASRFADDFLGSGWQWDDEPFYYSAQISALNCDENVVPLQATPAPLAGRLAFVTIGGKDAQSLGFGQVSSDYLTVQNTLLTSAAAPSPAPAISWGRMRGRSVFTVGGTLPQNAAPAGDAITVEDPASFTAYRLADLLPLVRIAYPVRRIGKGIVPPNAVRVAADNSAPLSALLVHFLKTSDNLYGECLLRTIGAEKGAKGSASEGAKRVAAFLQTAGVDDSGLLIADGSGLSRVNHVTPRTLVGLLTFLDQKFPKESKNVWQAALPIGGVDGTLRNRFKNTPAQNNVIGKTGTLSGVSALSGYVSGKSGKRYVFSLLMNNFVSSAEARGVQDVIVTMLAEE